MTREFISAAFGALLIGAMAGGPAQAAGCLKGAVIGGAGGHFLGHHALLGAGAGCVIGHHEAAKHARERAREQQQMQPQGSTTGYDPPRSGYGR